MKTNYILNCSQLIKNSIKVKIVLMLVWALAAFASLTSCQSHNKETIKLEQYLQQRQHTTLQNKTYVIIPLNICGSCVDNMLNMIRLYSKNPDDLVIILTDYTSLTIKKKMPELSEFHILTDNKMNIANDGVIPGDKIVIIKVEDKHIVKMLPYLVGENDNEIKNTLSQQK